MQKIGSADKRIMIMKDLNDINERLCQAYDVCLNDCKVRWDECVLADGLPCKTNELIRKLEESFGIEKLEGMTK